MRRAEKDSIEKKLKELAVEADAGRNLRNVEIELKRLVRPVNLQGTIVVVPRQTIDALDMPDLDTHTFNTQRIETISMDALSADFVMDMKRGAKRERYFQLKNDPAYSGPRILAEGDSWIEYPCAKDNGEWLGERYALLSLAKAGATWHDIIAEQNKIYPDGSSKNLHKNIDAERPHIVLLSVGGNEIIANMAAYVKHYAMNRPARDYITDDFWRMLDYVIATYRSHITDIVAKKCSVIMHGYDYPDPRVSAGGQWIAPRLLYERNIDDVTLWREIPNIMLREFDTRMRALAGEFPGKAHFVRLLGTIGSKNIIDGPDRALWEDEVHGSTLGFEKISAELAKKIDDVWQQIQAVG
jgi:hypothetical protein